MDVFSPLTDSLTAVVLLTVLCGYCFGSVPFGLVIGQLWLKQDIRDTGSGNIGATNMLRTGNKHAAFATLLLDMLKGVAPCLIFLAITPAQFARDLALLAGVAAIIGHVYPVWLDFKGGKGIATSVGVIIAMHYPLALVFIGTWLLIAAVMHYSSLASLIAIVLMPVIAIIFDYSSSAIFAYLFIAAIAIFRHRGNISRLLDRQEPTISLLTPAPAAPSWTSALDSPASTPPHAFADLPQQAQKMAEEDDWDDIPPLPPEMIKSEQTNRTPPSSPPLTAQNAATNLFNESDQHQTTETPASESPQPSRSSLRVPRFG